MSIGRIFSVEGKVAFITGAAHGLGEAMAEAIAENGGRVALFDLDAEGVKATAERLAASGFEVLAFSGSVSDRAAVEAALGETVARFGRLDIAIANAGISDPLSGLLHETTDESWNRVVDVNLQGLFHTCRAALSAMMQTGSGKLITIASMWGHVAPAGLQPRPAYAATKGAVINLTRELGVQYAPHNIQVNAICPGFFRTHGRPRTEEQAKLFEAYTPMGRIAAADEIKGAVLYLASSASDFVTGTTLVIDGGVLAQ